MFTGIIEATAEVIGNARGALMIRRPASFDDLRRGSSVCVAGACLTVTDLSKETMGFDVIAETLEKTKIGSLKKGDAVNLERALRAGGRFDGHIVQGHVEDFGEVRSAGSGSLTIAVPSVLTPFIVAKGAITIDGVSLTVVDARGDSFSVALIPETLARTTLGALHEGDRVNIETDILARYVRQFLPSRVP